MANEKNLIPNSQRSPTEVRANSAKGGRKSGETRRKKKAIREILNGYLDGSIKNNAQMQALARKLGLNDNATIKEVFVIGCMINSMKHGDLGTIGELSDLIGEQGQQSDNENDNMVALADLINKPKPNRNISDFEDAKNE